MNRREALRLSSHALLLTALSPLPMGCARRITQPTAAPPRLFFDPGDVARIRANAQTPLLQPVFAAWAAETPDAARQLIDQAVTGNIINDFRIALEAMTRQAVVHLVEPNAARRDVLIYGIETMIGRPKWDYFLEGGTEVIGIMRASMANARLLFTRDVLGEDLDPTLEAALLDAVAEKGCLPCYRTIYGMDHQSEVAGWSFDDQHQSVYEIDMRRWPEILGANNLRAIPTMGLGLGALVLHGHDDRAALWLDTAVASARRFLDTFSPDGSYFEGISYIDYALRTLLSFLDAHRRLVGTVDWIQEAHFAGMIDFILAMQAGWTDDSTPDVVNFSDSRRSVYPCIPSWIAAQTGSEVAQFAAEHVSEPGSYLDFLWYDPDHPSAPPPDALENARLDLGWIIARTGWAPHDAVLAFRSGGPANHEHADRNSFLFKIHGERLLTDPFGAAYDWRQPGWLLRLTEAHNAVLIDRQGHQYHRGEEGTNESQAEARIVHYEAEGDRVWWTSDATQAYQLVDPDVATVVRTVVFAKPNVIVLLDRVEKRAAPSRVDVRFFPDNRDGEAQLRTEGTSFTIHRPGAGLHGWTQARSALTLATHRLDLPEDLGVFPFVEVTSPEATTHEIATVLVARQAEVSAVPPVTLQPDAEGWHIDVGDQSLRLDTTGAIPVVQWA